MIGIVREKRTRDMSDGAKILFLRGKVPTDRDPRQIMFDSLDDCDDAKD